MNLSESLAAFVLEMLPSENLPEVASEAMEAGFESSSLAALAGSSIRTPTPDLRHLFVRAIDELELPIPSELEAAEVLKGYFARQVAAGCLSPKQGACRIVEDVYWSVSDQLSVGGYVGEEFGIARLIGLYYAYDDLPPNAEAEIGELDAAIVEECGRLIAT